MSASKLRAALNRLRDAVMPKGMHGLTLITGPARLLAPHRLDGDPDEIISIWGTPGRLPHAIPDMDPRFVDLVADPRQDDSDWPMDPLPGRPGPEGEP